jgi:hypothetical protein
MVSRLPVRNEFGLQWMLTGPNQFQVCGRTAEALPPGAYTCWLDHCGNPHYQARDLHADEMIHFPDSLSAKVLAELSLFWASGDRFARYGFLHRRGYLLYGKQGCGKSSLIHQIVRAVVADGHVAFFCTHPHAFVQAAEKFRQVEPDRPVVCVFEDLDAIIEEHGDAELLQWLDGNSQVDRAVNIASTNYPEKLDRRIVSRPRRFDRILRIDAPDGRVREAYFGRKVPDLSAAELRAWVGLTDGLPFAALAEMVISVRCLGNGLEESAALLKSLDAHSPSSLEFADGAGDAKPDGAIPF